MNVINIRENPELTGKAIEYFNRAWGRHRNRKVFYEDCISRSIDAKNPLPIFYLLMDSKKIIGCAEVIMSANISCMDLFPWLCSLQIEKEYRGQNLGNLLISRIKHDVAKMGFDNLYLFTDFDGYYEKFGFAYIGDGYHPCGRSSRVYEFSFNEEK